MYYRTLAIVFGTLVVGSTRAADDPVEARLVAAKAEYERATVDARERLLADLRRLEDDAKGAGILNLVVQTRREIKAFEENRTLPASGPVNGYVNKVRLAQARLDDAYVAATKQYTREGKVALAKAVREEWDAFKADGLRPLDAVKFGDKYFKVFDTVLTWHEAKAACERIGRHLAVIESAEENKLVTELVGKSESIGAWLGATDEKKEGEWVWVTGKRMAYNNWGRGVRGPDNARGIEHYLVMGPNGRWDDQPNKKANADIRPGYVCQWE